MNIELEFLKINIEAKKSGYTKMIAEMKEQIETADENIKPIYEKALYKYEAILEVLNDIK
jgi:hypothetical protein